jgi:hypothetical protein
LFERREKELKNEIKHFHIIFIPKKSHLCEKKLKELGVYGSFKDNIKEYFLDLMPLDYDVLSMENPELFRVSFALASLFDLKIYCSSIFRMRSCTTIRLACCT